MSTNRNNEQVKRLVERWFNVEREFEEAKSERNDMVKDLKAEIKSRADELGTSVKEIGELVKIKLNESEVRQQVSDMQDYLDAYEVIFGEATRPIEDDEV